MRQRRREVTANDPSSSKVHRREGCPATVQIKPIVFTLFRCTSAELLFSCCGSVAAPRASAWAPRSSICDAQPGSGRGAAIKYLRCTSSGTAGNGLGTTIKYLPGAAGIGLNTSIKYLRRTTRQRPGHHDQVPATYNERRLGQRPEHHDQAPVV
jgi:hypothetical protein